MYPKTNADLSCPIWCGFSGGGGHLPEVSKPICAPCSVRGHCAQGASVWGHPLHPQVAVTRQQSNGVNPLPVARFITKTNKVPSWGEKYLSRLARKVTTRYYLWSRNWMSYYQYLRCPWWKRASSTQKRRLSLSTPGSLDLHMGHFPQDGENEQNVSFFWSFTVTKRFDFFKFSQLFWRDYVRWSLKILSFWSLLFFWFLKKLPISLHTVLKGFEHGVQWDRAKNVIFLKIKKLLGPKRKYF